MTPHEIEHAAAEPQPANRLSLVDRYRLQTWFLGIIAFSMILFLLVQARFILISLVIAIILFSLTADAITAFSRLRIGSWKITNWLASVGAFAMIAVILLTLTGIIISQINTVVTTTLGYTDQAIAAMARLAAWISPEAEQMVETSIRSIQVSTYISTLAGQASNLLSATTLVILFVGFLFAERLWFNTKLENLLHDKAQAKRVGRIIHSIVRRVNHYLLVKTGVSLATALAVYLLMEGFRLDFAGPMAILTFVLNYIPSVGSIIATILLGLVALIQVTEPATALLVFVLAGMIQFVLGSVIDPMLMGRALRVSSFGIIISLAFWGALWGIAGMFLAVPIMVAAMIVCSHIPAARPVAVLLSREGLPEIEEAGTVTDEGEPIRRAAE
ncbi:AI-2E family transporter [Pararhodobacter aggregans]|uniref:AI-2E family transporter n=1 Tax=Pararhodobacter aggregans TaxID=404875 RepID=A0A2T7UMX8_9RHOB|nr:AI-2E family transporter [Pararhodobacter aggregans]PTX02444.1 putative PurR-regulated permease PerM [Pararhodobacter aggregans]PVE46055.1 AI-2E family transporter [Pararhodobacter aggregans]